MALPTAALRRVPVFFLLDNSTAVKGALHVAVHEGMQAMQYTLLRHAIARRIVYLSAITFGEQVQVTPLQPLLHFECVPLSARGTRPLAGALQQLHQALEYTVIPDDAFGPGDARPLVFIILGGAPDPGWEAHLHALAQIGGNRRPAFVMLGMDRMALHGLKFDVPGGPSAQRLALRACDATHLAPFFEWVAEALTGLCDTAIRGGSTVVFPPLPLHVVQL